MLYHFLRTLQQSTAKSMLLYLLITISVIVVVAVVVVVFFYFGASALNIANLVEKRLIVECVIP